MHYPGSRSASCIVNSESNRANTRFKAVCDGAVRLFPTHRRAAVHRRLCISYDTTRYVDGSVASSEGS